MRWGWLVLLGAALGCSGGGGNPVDSGGIDAMTGVDASTPASSITLGVACESAAGDMSGPYAFVTGLAVLSASPDGVCTVVPYVNACSLAINMLKAPADHCLGQTISGPGQCCTAMEVTSLARQFCGSLPAIQAGMTADNYAAIASWNPCPVAGAEM